MRFRIKKKKVYNGALNSERIIENGMWFTSWI